MTPLQKASPSRSAGGVVPAGPSQVVLAQPLSVRDGGARDQAGRGAATVAVVTDLAVRFPRGGARSTPSTRGCDELGVAGGLTGTKRSRPALSLCSLSRSLARGPTLDGTLQAANGSPFLTPPRRCCPEVGLAPHRAKRYNRLHHHYAVTRGNGAPDS